MSQPASPAGPDTRGVARSYFEQLSNQHDLPFVDQLFDPEIAFYDPAIPGEAMGLDQVRDFFTTFFKAFPDVNFEIDDFFRKMIELRFDSRGRQRIRPRFWE